MKKTFLFTAAMVVLCAGASWAQKASLPFIEDDYARALAQSREQNRPLFVEVWAAWCHTCRYMRSYVFTDRALTKQSGRFVWLAIDAERPKNAAFVERFPYEALPMVLVVDARTEKALLKWYGSATVDQVAALLNDGERAWEGGAEGANALLAHADRINGEGKSAEAARAYQEALQAGGQSWPARPRAVESLLMAWRLAGQSEPCARAAVELAPSLARGRSFLNAVDTGLGCALEGDKAEWAKAAVGKLKPLEEEALRLPDQLADDRAAVYLTLLDVYEGEAATKLAAEFAAFLEDHAKTAPNPEARASMDSYRAGLAIRMKEPMRAVPALQISERELPNDYNPPARLANLYSAMGRYEEALAASDRALAKVYGARRILVLSSRASIYENKGDKTAARALIEEAMQLASSLPMGELYQPGLTKQLERLK